MAGRDAQIDSRGKLGDGESAVLLEFSKNLEINGVDGQDLTRPRPIPWKIRNHLLDVQA